MARPHRWLSSLGPERIGGVLSELVLRLLINRADPRVERRLHEDEFPLGALLLESVGSPGGGSASAQWTTVIEGRRLVLSGINRYVPIVKV